MLAFIRERVMTCWGYFQLELGHFSFEVTAFITQFTCIHMCTLSKAAEL